MKHMTIVFLSGLLIFAYSIFNYVYIDNFTSSVEKALIYNKTNAAVTADKINKYYSKNKTLLEFVVNKEATEALNEYLICFNNAVLYKNSKEIELYRNLLLESIYSIKEQNRCII